MIGGRAGRPVDPAAVVRKPHRFASFIDRPDPGTAVAPSMTMADRRRNKRIRLTEPAAGAFRLFPDLLVQQDGLNEWIGISRQPAAAGETLVLDVVQFDAVEGEIHRRLPVCVVESRPVIVDGDMHHRIRLDSGIMALVSFEQQVRRG
jgi:hypothetical protein